MITVLKNATLYTMDESNTVIQNCDLWIQGGWITYIGTDSPIPSNTQVIDCTGKVVTPGLIDAHTHVGIWGEINEQQNDANEYSDPWTPSMAAVDGIDIRHFSFDLAVEGGVTTIQTGAGSANPIAGTWSILKTGGGSLEDRLLVERSGLKGALGENPKNLFGNQYQKKPMTRMAVAEIIRQGFQDAQKLTVSEQKFTRENAGELLPFIQVLAHEMPLRLHCHRADDIATAIRIANEFNVKLSLEHCTEGHMMLDAVKRSGASVTLGPFMLPPSKYETRNSTPAAPKMFHDAEIPFAIMTDHPFIPIQYLIYCAAEAVKYGLDEMAALKSITFEAARLMGVEEKVGSLEMGKHADFVIWSHEPFQAQANVLSTYINGQSVYERTLDV